MISSQIIQTSIEELKTITKVDLCVYDVRYLEIVLALEGDSTIIKSIKTP